MDKYNLHNIGFIEYSEMSTIKVVVRVRPLNEVEISQNCTVVVKTEKSQVTVTNPETERSKTFTFDDAVSSVSLCLLFRLYFIIYASINIQSVTFTLSVSDVLGLFAFLIL